METVVSSAEPELHLLTEWTNREDQARWREAGALSVLVHVVVVTFLVAVPVSVTVPQKAAPHQITPLIAPLRELTQTAPNKGKVGKEFNVEALLPRPRVFIPPSPRSTTRPAAPTPSLPSPPPALPEPPKIETADEEGPKLQVAQIAPPQIQPQEQKPKLAFETPSAPPPPRQGAGKIPIPDTSVNEAVRSAIRGGAGGGAIVGDIGIGAGGIGEGLNLPPSPGRPASALELLSDPMGVDFRPYLIQVLSMVRRNWFAVMPESAKLGVRGRVGIQFAISRNGAVPKLVIVTHSGTDALDRAAVVGISASNPFPPLPSEYKGDQVRLQFTFQYNMPRN